MLEAWPHLREINYMSASALRKLEQDPVAFYWDRLGPPEKKPAREPTEFPAAVGITFDAWIKSWLSGQLSLKCPKMTHMIRELNKFERKGEAIRLGATLLNGYISSGAATKLLSEVPIKIADIIEDDIDDVPVQCKLDLETAAYGPHDWKVTGANKPGEYSPKPGYQYLWDTDKPGLAKTHERWQEPMENIDEDWATQIAIYILALGRGTGSIDQIVVGKDGRVRVAQYRTGPSSEYIQSVRERLARAWEKIQTGKVIGEMERAMA